MENAVSGNRRKGAEFHSLIQNQNAEILLLKGTEHRIHHGDMPDLSDLKELGSKKLQDLILE